MYPDVCAFSGLMRGPMSWCNWDTLSSCCYTSLAASWVSLDVLLIRTRNQPGGVSCCVHFASALPGCVCYGPIVNTGPWFIIHCRRPARVVILFASKGFSKINGLGPSVLSIHAMDLNKNTRYSQRSLDRTPGSRYQSGSPSQTLKETSKRRWEGNTNSKHWFTTSFLQPLPYLVTP